MNTLPKHNVVCLQPAEIRLADYIATVRYQFNERMGYKSMFLKKEFEGRPIDFMAWSFRAELAACRNFNVYPDLATDKREPYDFVLPTGQMVDVKACLDTDDSFTVAAWKKKTPISADWYVCMRGRHKNFEYMGCISARKVFDREPIEAEKPYYRINLDELSI